MKEKILSWVAGRASSMEDCIVSAAENYLTRLEEKGLTANLCYDLRESRSESFGLSQGKDLCYDRFSTPLMYSMWYQGRRINTSLPIAAEFVVTAITEGKPIRVFDLGAGTGAVQLALGMCIEAASALGLGALPIVRIINVDTSPFMLDYGRRYLHPAFKKMFPKGFGHILTEYETISWTSFEMDPSGQTYVVASYLFDHSERKEEAGIQFESMIRDLQPRYIVLLSDFKKKAVIDQFITALDRNQFSVQKLPQPNALNGLMKTVAAFRTAFDQQHGTTFGDSAGLVWQERSFYGCKVTPLVQGLGLDFEKQKLEIDLYQQPIRVRNNVALSEDQKKAAIPSGSRTIIMGPAGSGKSVVITERIKAIIEDFDYDKEISILLTTFNNELTDYLQEWMKSLLDYQRVSYSGDDNECFHFDLSPVPNLTILNFDKLPTRLAGLKGPLITKKRDIESRMKIAIDETLEENEINTVSDLRILEPQFLYQEFIRVVYGQKCLTLTEYKNASRVNPPFRLFEKNREIVWKIISRFLIICKDGRKGWSPASTIYQKRLRLYQQLKNGQVPTYSYLFVDELQDCTEGDYQIFYGLLEDNDELVIAGDYAQSVHLGKTVRPPKAEDQFRTSDIDRRFRKHTLAGSYRLPFRISECIRPLSEYINKSRTDLDVDILSPYRGAPPGARPILVYASSEEAMVGKLAAILGHYQIYDQVRQDEKQRHTLTILEMDTSLSSAINLQYPTLASTDTILSLKGMEKDCIVWSTRTSVNNPGEEEYYVYTILTRTRSTLIIALFHNTPSRYQELIKTFNPNRFMIWDYETQHYYQNKIQNLPAQVATA